jgi:hypothetical protein
MSTFFVSKENDTHQFTQEINPERINLSIFCDNSDKKEEEEVKNMITEKAVFGGRR